MTSNSGEIQHASALVNANKRRDSLTYISLGVIFAAAGPLESATIGPFSGYYVLVLLLILIAFFRATSSRHTGEKMTGLAKISVIAFPLLWVYGVIVGLAYLNPTAFVFRNFAGMLLYPFAFFIFQSRPDPRTILNFLRYVGILVALVSVILYQTTSGIVNSAAIFVAGTHSQIDVGTTHPRILFGGQYVLFALYALAIDRVLTKGIGLLQRTIAIAEIVIVLYVAVVCSDSKGYLLALLLIAAAMMLVSSRDATRSQRERGASVALRLFALVLLIPFAAKSVYDVIFSTGLSGNVLRTQQIHVLLDNVNLLGRGLGAVIPGYVRSEDFDYGFEISYLSVAHKLGVFSFVAFGLLAATFIVALRGWARRGPSRPLFAGALGCMGYLFPALGNPILFAPSAVALNCLALYLLDAGRNPTVDRHDQLPRRSVASRPGVAKKMSHRDQQGIRVPGEQGSGVLRGRA